LADRSSKLTNSNKGGQKMKTRLLKISILIVGLMFVFTAASWADNGKTGHRKYAPEKRIQAKNHGGRSYRQPVDYKHKIIRYNKHYYRQRPAQRPMKHKFYHRKQWIKKHRPLYRHGRHYSDNSYEDDAAYNEFSIAATISDPGVEFSIGTKRTW